MQFVILPKQFRIFIYGAFGLSALIGGITSLTQLAASESKCDRLDRGGELLLTIPRYLLRCSSRVNSRTSKLRAIFRYVPLLMVPLLDASFLLTTIVESRSLSAQQNFARAMLSWTLVARPCLSGTVASDHSDFFYPHPALLVVTGDPS